VKKNTVLVGLFSILVVLLITYFYFGRPDKKPFSWDESYKADSDQPYGTLFIRKLLESYRPGEKFIHLDSVSVNTILTKDSISYPADYVFIGNELSLSNDDVEALLDFIYAGNDAFVATRFLPYSLIDSIFSEECENEMYLSDHISPSATLNFYHPSLHSAKGYEYIYKPGSQLRDYKWMALQSDVFCDSARSLVALGYFEDKAVNFFRLPFGEGNLYVHTNPIVFTNYYIRSRDKMEYAASVFSHLRGKTVIWDEYSRSQFIPEDNSGSNPLALIMQHESLMYAWWMMLVSAILYTVFTAKRRQRIVPIREEKVNTSLEYVKMVSALHFENGNNKDIALKKMKYFFYFIRSKYGIQHTQLTHDQLKRLSEKAQVEPEHIESIFTQYHKIEKNPYETIGAHQLVSLYNAIDHFYKNCK
jgi:hypothetical protein